MPAIRGPKTRFISFTPCYHLNDAYLRVDSYVIP